MTRILFCAGLLAAFSSAQGRPYNFMTTNSPNAAFASGGYGANATGMGDVDGDGFEDYAVVAPGAGVPVGTFPNNGVIYVQSGRRGELILTMIGDQPGAMMGNAMLSVGDVSGDGIPDLAVGSPSHDLAFGNGGRVTMYSGSDGSVLWTSDGEAIGRERGSCLAATPDLTGDGIPDLVTGEPGSDIGGAGRGRAVFLNGATGGEFGEAIGPLVFASFGKTMAGTVSQMAVFVGDGAGRTYELPAPIVGGSTPVLFRDKPPGGHVPVQLALIPKVAGGHRIAIGLSSADITGNNSGVLWLHELNGLELFARPGVMPIAGFGFEVARGQDLDGNGEDEIVAARADGSLMPSIIEIVRQDGTLQAQLSSGCADGPDLHSIGDTTGDGRGELLVSFASGQCGIAETWLFGTGMEVTVTQNGAGDVQASADIDFGAGRAGQSYWQLFSISGTEPGLLGPSPWPLVPLNIDGVTTVAQSLSGGPLAPNTSGVLDAVGRGQSTLTVPASVAQILSGIPFQSVALVLDGAGQNITATSNPTTWVMP
tara:strand:+ start:21979 stop:23592 length:1614 start_codon:yes stop_codon:yes gene_type:complete